MRQSMSITRSIGNEIENKSCHYLNGCVVVHAVSSHAIYTRQSFWLCSDGNKGLAASVRIHGKTKTKTRPESLTRCGAVRAPVRGVI